MQSEKGVGSHARPFEAVDDEQQQRKACKALWDAVLAQGLKDCSGRPSFDEAQVAASTNTTFRELIHLSKEERARRVKQTKDALVDEALKWALSDEVSVGSSAWICQMLDYDHDRIKDVAKSIYESGLKNHVEKSGLHAVLWHVEKSAPAAVPSIDRAVPMRRAVRLYEEEFDG